MTKLLILTLIAINFLSVALAVEPGEILEDAALENRARKISQQVKCLVCQNETIDESNAPLAKDLRILIREQLVKGMSDEEVFQFLTDRYGEFILLKPTFTGGNMIVYLAGPILFLFALGGAFSYIKRQQKAINLDHQSLSTSEQQQLDELIQSD